MADFWGSLQGGLQISEHSEEEKSNMLIYYYFKAPSVTLKS
jgi:hypothetical protein